MSEASHRHTQERLRRIGDVVDTEGGDGLLTASAQVRLVVDEQWGAVGGGKVGQANATDRQLATVIDRRRRGQEMERHGSGGHRRRVGDDERPIRLRFGGSVPGGRPVGQPLASRVPPS